ncbi:T9SS type B sorting domain-containing protein [Emticicia agri]|uniref:T9SS type B sorting domain-containing protein n=1 Tax=Emticicia agri TaxID=2492393 RepID=UPI0013EB187B|nr:gliding motility-associated C-terminal domain-containing protein [Emticicia agri]
MLGFIILCTTITTFGQQDAKPIECTTLPPGHTPNADFSINPQTGCLTADNRAAGALVLINEVRDPSGTLITTLPGSSVKFNFNYRDVDGPITFPANASTPTNRYKGPGKYWIVMNGVVGTTSYLTCKSVEIIDTQPLNFKYDFCSPQDVTVLIEDTPTNRAQPKILIEWGDGNTQTIRITTFPHTITHHFDNVPTVKPKIQGLYERGGIDACTSDARNLDVANTDPPKIVALEGLAGGTQQKITIRGGTADVDFNIEMKPKGGSWSATGKTIKLPTTANATATETITVPNAGTEYCFRLQKNGICSSSIVSDPLCTILPTHQVLSSTDVKIDWQSESFTSITRYQVSHRDSPSNLNPNSYDVPVSANPTFTFDQMDCSTKYEFWIVGSWFSGGTKIEIKSAPFIVEPLKGGNIPFANLAIVSLGDNLVKINTLYPFPEITIYRAEGNSTNFQKAATIQNTTLWEDKNVEINQQQYCYKLEYKDACDNTSEQSTPVCTVFLTSAQPNTLNWTPFSVSDPTGMLQNVGATEYYVQVIDELGVLQNVAITTNTEAEVRAAIDQYLQDPLFNGKVTFRILARQDAELMWGTVLTPFPFSSYSNTYTFITPAILYVPTAFTPNDDTVNDVFKANGKFISEFNMVIYNRWGAPIFETRDIELGWNGTEAGAPAPQGNYSYKIFGTDYAGQEFKKVGSVLLLK